jgi:hypothetical protein
MSRQRAAVVVASGALLVAATGTVALATQHASTQNICVGKVTGLVRIAKHCNHAERADVLPAQGQQGATGPQGLPGAAGPAGVLGPQGTGAGLEIYDTNGRQVGKMVDADDVLIGGLVWQVNSGSGKFSPEYAGPSYTTSNCTGTPYYEYETGDPMGHVTFGASARGSVVATGAFTTVTLHSFTAYSGFALACRTTTDGYNAQVQSASSAVTPPADVIGPLAVR